jgi:hypothetical protein
MRITDSNNDDDHHTGGGRDIDMHKNYIQRPEKAAGDMAR